MKGWKQGRYTSFYRKVGFLTLSVHRDLASSKAEQSKYKFAVGNLQSRQLFPDWKVAAEAAERVARRELQKALAALDEEE